MTKEELEAIRWEAAKDYTKYPPEARKLLAHIDSLSAKLEATRHDEHSACQRSNRLAAKVIQARQMSQAWHDAASRYRKCHHASLQAAENAFIYLAEHNKVIFERDAAVAAKEKAERENTDLRAWYQRNCTGYEELQDEAAKFEDRAEKAEREQAFWEARAGEEHGRCITIERERDQWKAKWEDLEINRATCCMKFEDALREIRDTAQCVDSCAAFAIAAAALRA